MYYIKSTKKNSSKGSFKNVQAAHENRLEKGIPISAGYILEKVWYAKKEEGVQWEHLPKDKSTMQI